MATPEATEIIRLLEDQHTFAGHALQGASQEALNWKPASTPCDSLAGLVHHLVEVQRLWLDTVIDGEPVPPGLAAVLLPLAPLLNTPGTRPGLFADPVRLPGPACPGDQLVAFLGRQPRFLAVPGSGGA